MACFTASSFSMSRDAVASSSSRMGLFFQNGPGNGDALALPAGEQISILARGGIIALFHAADKAVAVCLPAGRLDFLVRGIGACVADIVTDGVIKEEHILIHHGDLLQHPLRRHTARGLPPMDMAPPLGS